MVRLAADRELQVDECLHLRVGERQASEKVGVARKVEEHRGAHADGADGGGDAACLAEPQRVGVREGVTVS